MRPSIFQSLNGVVNSSGRAVDQISLRHLRAHEGIGS